jgi:hypothetical protein
LHFVALVLAATGMRPGSPLVPLRDRLDYLAGAPLGWTVGWVAWMFCAFALIAYLATLTHRLGAQALLAQLALMVAIAGLACDLLCDSIYIVILPMLASRQPQPEALFLTVERVTGIGSLVIANGAYSAAILLFTKTLQTQQRLARLPTGIGYAVAGFGLLLATAGFTGIPWIAPWVTPPMIGLFCLWVVLVARSLEAEGRAS